MNLKSLSDFFLTSMSNGALCFSISGRVVFTNEKAKQIFFPIKEIIDSTTIFDLIPDLNEVSWKKLLTDLRKKESLTLKFDLPIDSKKSDSVETDASIFLYPHLDKEYIFFVINYIAQKQKEDYVVKMDLKKETDYNFNEIISISDKYKEVLSLVGTVAPTDATVLLLGESGTGKELLSRAIHRLSHRVEAPFIKVNCAVLSNNFLESELFGHEKGAFTGATDQRKGKFEIAHNGTIFLDEIGELPLNIQAKLLRVVQEKEFSRLGGNDVITSNVRIIAATNRNLKKMVAKGKFREDLFFRLNVFPIENIPLRERPEDIPLLAKFFTLRFAKKLGKSFLSIQPKDMEKLLSYKYPGNVRELENLIERAVILTKHDILNLDFFEIEKEHLRKIKDKTLKTLEESQRNHILKALKKAKWKVSGTGGAAELLAINAQTLESKMRKLKIFRKDFLK